MANKIKLAIANAFYFNIPFEIRALFDLFEPPSDKRPGSPEELVRVNLGGDFSNGVVIFGGIIGV